MGRAPFVDSEIASFPRLGSANLLLIGSDAATREFLAPLIASAASPVVYCTGTSPEFPDGPVGSLLVRDVGSLTPVHQQRLLDWLNNRRHWSVIATSAGSVFSMVKSGVFAEDLYYRLNTVTLLLNQALRLDVQARRKLSDL
jgi:hypothetical protein